MPTIDTSEPPAEPSMAERFRRRELPSRRIRGRLVLPRPDGRTGTVLTGGAAEIWDLLAAPRSRDELVVAMHERDHPAELVDRVLTELLRDGLVRDELLRDGLVRDGLVRDGLVRDGLVGDGLGDAVG